MGRGYLCIGNGHASQELGLVVRELVHRRKRDVESAHSGMVYRENVDTLAGISVGELPAGSTARRVPASNGEGTTDVGESGQITKLLVSYAYRISRVYR